MMSISDDTNYTLIDNLIGNIMEHIIENMVATIIDDIRTPSPSTPISSQYPLPTAIYVHPQASGPHRYVNPYPNGPHRGGRP